MKIIQFDLYIYFVYIFMFNFKAYTTDLLVSVGCRDDIAFGF